MVATFDLPGTNRAHVAGGFVVTKLDNFLVSNDLADVVRYLPILRQHHTSQLVQLQHRMRSRGTRCPNRYQEKVEGRRKKRR